MSVPSSLTWKTASIIDQTSQTHPAFSHTALKRTFGNPLGQGPSWSPCRWSIMWYMAGSWQLLTCDLPVRSKGQHCWLLLYRWRRWSAEKLGCVPLALEPISRTVVCRAHNNWGSISSSLQIAAPFTPSLVQQYFLDSGCSATMKSSGKLDGWGRREIQKVELVFVNV